MSAGDHLRDAANMMDTGMHDAAKRHLRAAIANMTPQSLTRHGNITDEQHNLAKRSMDDVHRHLLLVQQDQDEGDGGQETEHHPDVKARTDVTEPVPSGRQAMGTYSNDGGSSYEFADPMAGAYQALELAHAQAAQRGLEDARDAVRLARRRTGTSVSEDRLGAALARISRGTYTATGQQRAMGFANDTAAGMVERAAEQAGGWDSTACTCTPDGIPAMTRFHTLNCPEAELTPDMMGEVREDVQRMAIEPALDANGNGFYDQYGLPAGMTTLLQASAGERLLNLSPGGFETGHRQERILPQRQIRFGDPDEPGDPGQGMTGRSAEYVRGLADTMGLASPTAAQARERGAQRLAVTGQHRHYRSWGDRMDNDPLIRQRAEQIKGTDRLAAPAAGPAEFSNTYADGSYGDGVRLPGELPRYTLG